MGGEARTAREVHELFIERFNAGNGDGLVALYEPEAILWPPGAAEPVSGHDAIRQVLDGLLAMGAKMENEIVQVIAREDIAILYSRWSVRGTAMDGQAVAVGGMTSDVVRRHADGHWLFAIDNPLGGGK